MFKFPQIRNSNCKNHTLILSLFVANISVIAKDNNSRKPLHKTLLNKGLKPLVPGSTPGTGFPEIKTVLFKTQCYAHSAIPAFAFRLGTVIAKM
jgi:hypothetical protein